jgi:hypothetical protein
MEGLLEKAGLRAPAPPPAPAGLGGLRLPPFLRPPDGAPHRARKSEPLGGIQAKIVARLRDQATAAITGGVSGVLVLLTVYKVVSSRESVLAESRKEQQRQVMERKARLANTRRSLAGPLRSAARDLQTRVREILLPTPPTGEPRHNYFASHYLEDPEESVNTTLYRLCRYLFWVEQLQRGAHADGELALDDAWQVAVDVRLERVRQALASSDELVDATRARERLYDVIDAAVRREAERKRREASERRKSADADEKAFGRRTKEGAFSAEEERRVRGEERATRSKTKTLAPARDGEGSGTAGEEDAEASSETTPSRTPAGGLLLRASSVKKNFFDAVSMSGGGKAKAKTAADEKPTLSPSPPSFKTAAAAVAERVRSSPRGSPGRDERDAARFAADAFVDALSVQGSPDEPGLRVSRYPLRLFRDTQMAVAEVFGEETGRNTFMRGHIAAGLRRNDSNQGFHAKGTGSSPKEHRAGGAFRDGDGGSGDRGFSGDRGSPGEMLYTDFVIKLEAAMAKSESVNEPWVRWMVPLHLQYHRYASLQARRQRQLTPAEGREVLAARVRLRRVSDALEELLVVLRRRLDDAWFQQNTKRLRREAQRQSSDAYSYHDAIRAAAVISSEVKLNRGRFKNRGAGASGSGGGGVLGPLFGRARAHRLWARQRAAREAAIERWEIIREALPGVVAAGAAWWDRPASPARPNRLFGMVDEDAVAEAARDASRVAARCLLEAAKRPVRTVAGALACAATLALGWRAKKRRGRVDFVAIKAEAEAVKREVANAAKRATERSKKPEGARRTEAAGPGHGPGPGPGAAASGSAAAAAAFAPPPLPMPPSPPPMPMPPTPGVAKTRVVPPKQPAKDVAVPSARTKEA